METKIPWVNSFNNKSLELVLFVTEQCNFRCRYCYEDFKSGNMDSEVITGIKNLINSRIRNMDTLYISFFGGEPLVNKKAVLALSARASDLCKEHGVTYQFSITTNGYLLTRNTFTELMRCGVSDYQITLDGDEQTHDKFRPTVTGKPTFQKIYANLIMMSQSNLDFRCLLRFNISDSNFKAIKSFFNNYSTPFANDERFSLHFHPIFGQENLRLTKKEYLSELTELVKVKGFKYETPSDNLVCYAGMANSFAIRADGTLQKCTVYLKNEINKLGKIQKNGHLNINEEKFKKWIFAYDKGCPARALAGRDL